MLQATGRQTRIRSTSFLFLPSPCIVRDALPFCHLALKGPKPLPPEYPKDLQTLGDHIRRRRLELGLFQKDAAKQIGVDEATIYNWESNETQPTNRSIPRIIQFLGYNPLPAAGTLSERLVVCRRALGLTQRAMARRLQVDPTTILSWETKRRRRSTKLSRIVEDFLKSHQATIGLKRCSIQTRLSLK
jgi:DNA-binding XRE family transcriptional regulator